MLEQLVEAWQINHRVTLKLLDALTDDALQATLSTRGGRATTGAPARKCAQAMPR
ncbi:MAG TPA: hypothetical protein VF333_03195 [Pyrinomonadaceae bacterium]|jgi:uncharacterized damage-inducible protein DinB